MKYFLIGIVALASLTACGGMSKQEKEEMKKTLDSASKDTTGQAKALDNAEDFLNDSNATTEKK